MIRNIIKTADGSSTIFLPELQDTYHSKHGAIQESNHIFIKTGLKYIVDNQQKLNLNILEIGFGTGLNCLMTFLENEKLNKNINYVGIEAFPITTEEAQQLNYINELNATKSKLVFEQIHQLSWNQKHSISPYFNLTKRLEKIENIADINQYDIIYFDAFGAQVQPELWTEIIFEKMYNALKKNGILVTYSAKGSVRRAMQSVGFQTERLPGPPGKREMLRATKI
ncbi:MAG: tRNA (5-methylaminomethyl-2-thiouridine)(34)-methyltransferase MnmD [Flavobacteriaceae bacterium]|nr:tRNA (5-methylaminomethyl-2-thiouridine)(34)-methyltransferase MnmD [Flavobacteriaceae bacterium]